MLIEQKRQQELQILNDRFKKEQELKNQTKNILDDQQTQIDKKSKVFISHNELNFHNFRKFLNFSFRAKTWSIRAEKGWLCPTKSVREAKISTETVRKESAGHWKCKAKEWTFLELPTKLLHSKRVRNWGTFIAFPFTKVHP